jgi:hypothetical protein
MLYFLIKSNGTNVEKHAKVISLLGGGGGGGF